MLELQKKQKIIVYLLDKNELSLKKLEQKMMLSTDYEIISYTSGDKFLNVILTSEPPKRSIRIAIVDFFMTSTDSDAKNGIELLKIIKDIDSSVEVIILSEKEDVDLVTSALHHGAITLIRKNEYSFERIQNNINWLISRMILKQKKKETQIMVFTFTSLLVVTITIFLLVAIFMPEKLG